MPDLRNAYYTLLCSAAQLALCRQACSVADLLAALRRLWSADGHSDAELLQAIDALNRDHRFLPDPDDARVEIQFALADEVERGRGADREGLAVGQGQHHRSFG